MDDAVRYGADMYVNMDDAIRYSADMHVCTGMMWYITVWHPHAHRDDVIHHGADRTCVQG